MLTRKMALFARSENLRDASTIVIHSYYQSYYRKRHTIQYSIQTDSYARVA